MTTTTRLRVYQGLAVVWAVGVLSWFALVQKRHNGTKRDLARETREQSPAPAPPP